ncbi:MAG: endonuclease/exonuclease/phosphatase family protein, partial [Caldilineaceae bacterium]|nr:endonuclease/exonuclease/phosphatase family protein [Caldilineaceae bacterium]
ATISWFTLLVLLYGGATTLWITWWLLRGDEGWLLILIDHYGSLPPLLAVPLLGITLWKRRWGLFPFLCPALIFFGVLFGPYWLPRLSATSTTADLSVMSYNVLSSNENYAAIANLLRTYHPDLVALQEVGPDHLAYLQEQLGDEYVAAHKAHEPDHSTTAILSRYPITNVTVLDLGAIRPAVIADLEIDGQIVTFVSAHLLYYGWLRIPWLELPAHMLTIHALQVQQVQVLAAELNRRHQDVVILGCDCNSVDTAATQQLLNHYLTNAAKVTGWTLPQPALPRLGPYYFPQRIDYVFYRGQVQPRGVYTIYDSAHSDHLPVLAYFDFRVSP